MFLAGVFNFLAHVLKVFICKFENAAFGALLTRSIDVMITFLGQYLFFNVNTKFNFKIHYIGGIKTCIFINSRKFLDYIVV